MPYPLASCVSRRSYGGGSAAPPLPPTTGAVAIWSLFNLNYPTFSDAGVNFTDGGSGNRDAAFDPVAPYSLPWAAIIDAYTPPYALDIWFDQLSANSLTATGSARPVLDAVGQQITFDGTQTGMSSTINLYDGSNTSGTLYIDVAPQSLIETGIILETGTGAVGNAGRISIRMVAGVLTASIYDGTAIASLPNTKVKTLSGHSRIWVCVTFDTTAAAANQVQLYVNNSQAGVTSTAAADLSGVQIGKDPANLGARNTASSNFLTADFWQVRAQSNLDDAAAMLIEYNYYLYLRSLAP